MNLKKYLLIFSLFIFANTYAQFNINTNPFWKAEMEMVDGTIKNGFAQVPNVSKLKNVIFKTSLNGEKESLKRNLIQKLKVESPNGKNYLYEKAAIVNTLKGNSSSGTALMLVEAKNDYVTFYIQSAAYRVNEETDEIVLFYRYQQGSDYPTIGRYIKKADAEKANMFYITNVIGGFKRCAMYHLTEDPALLEKIENNTLGKNEIPQIIAEYIATTNTK
ncbi:hypothetical protein [Aequorivita capsosiphonis]|uniref:hypothetical protein n=1 Tax=Aequorivita capsosiphonis TaxID=487317 RepID=UPI00040FB4E3|nr:hypothetical protein [Aequorivita capsosiphonis]